MNEVSSRRIPKQPGVVQPRGLYEPPSNDDLKAIISQSTYDNKEDALPYTPRPSYSYRNNPGKSLTNKNKSTAIILALLIGTLGAHRFYLGQTGKGILYVILGPLLISPILSLVDALRYMIMSKDEFAQKYGVN